MSPEVHIPCPVCGATVPMSMPRCRYCGVAIASAEIFDELIINPGGQQGLRNHALLIAIAATALPIQSALASLTPPYMVPSSAVALAPMALCAAVLGIALGAAWLPQRTWWLAPTLCGLFSGLSAALVLSWRRMVLPLDPDVWPFACTVAVAGLLAAWLGRGLGWLWRRGDNAVATDP